MDLWIHPILLANINDGFFFFKDPVKQGALMKKVFCHRGKCKVSDKDSTLSPKVV